MRANAHFREVGEAMRENGLPVGADVRKALGSAQVAGPRLSAKRGHALWDDYRKKRYGGTSRWPAGAPEHHRDMK